MEYKDYYKILGVPRTATSDEIKSAFRKLAREHHPDVAKDKKAGEEKFKEINEAYEVLHEPEKRRKYDQLGADWQSGGGMGGGGRPGYGFPGGGGGRVPDGMPEGWNTYDPEGEDVRFGGTGFSDFFESFFGQASAGGAAGMGGARRGPAASSKGRDITADIMVSLEEALHKHTRRITLQRTAQRGQPPTVETYQVHIPPGVREGQMIRVAGQGERGRGPNAKPGDLFLRVRLEQHPLFRVEGMDLYYDVDLAPWEAVLGTSLQVKSLDGYLSVKIPPLAVSGQKLRLRGQGLPTKEGGRGDLFVILDIETPPKVTPEQKELWEKLAATSDFNPRVSGV